MSNSENPSEYQLIFKRLAYGEVEPKGEPLTVLELEGNFAHLKDYINDLTRKLVDNTESITKMSESIKELQNRVEKLEDANQEDYNSYNYSNTDGNTLREIAKAAEDFGSKAGLDFGSIVDNPIFYNLGKREVGDDIYLQAKDGNYYLLNEMTNGGYILVDDTYSVRVSEGKITSIDETKLPTTITLIDTTTSVSGNLAKLYLAPDKGSLEQSLIYITESTFDENGEVVLEFDFSTIGQPSEKLLEEEQPTTKNFIIAAYSNDGAKRLEGQKIKPNPEPYWYDIIESDAKGTTLTRQSAKTVNFQLNVKLSTEESVESYPLYFMDNKVIVRELLGINGFQGEFDLTNDKGDTFLTITFEQDLIIYSEVFTIGDMSYEAIDLAIYYDELSDGGIYTNSFTLVEIESTTTTTTTERRLIYTMQSFSELNEFGYPEDVIVDFDPTTKNWGVYGIPEKSLTGDDLGDIGTLTYENLNDGTWKVVYSFDYDWGTITNSNTQYSQFRVYARQDGQSEDSYNVTYKPTNWYVSTTNFSYTGDINTLSWILTLNIGGSINQIPLNGKLTTVDNNGAYDLQYDFSFSPIISNFNPTINIVENYGLDGETTLTSISAQMR